VLLTINMRTHVTFRYPAEFVSDSEGILAVSGVQWFVALLRRVPNLQIDDELCQEDWGVVLYARREDKKFWIGLSMWEGEHSWLSHFHHASFAWLQRLSSSGKRELQRVLCDFHAVLASEPAVSDIVWYEGKELDKARPGGFPTPGEG
jgi:hypothetical protein